MKAQKMPKQKPKNVFNEIAFYLFFSLNKANFILEISPIEGSRNSCFSFQG